MIAIEETEENYWYRGNNGTIRRQFYNIYPHVASVLLIFLFYNFFYRGNRGGLVEGSCSTSPPQLGMEAEDSDSPAPPII